MKKLIFFTIGLLFLFLIGCNKNDSGDGNPVGLGTNSGNENVTFQVNIVQDQQGTLYFHFKPSVNVKIIKVDAQLNNQTYSVSGDVNTTITATEGFSVEVSNPETGDDWIFTITGKIAGNNQDFTSVVKYSVPTGYSGGAETVSFEINSQPGQQGGVDFLFKPSVDVKITKVDVKMGDASDKVDGDGTTVCSGGKWYVLAGYNGVESGQQWSFTFVGKTASDDKDYNVISNYTIP